MKARAILLAAVSCGLLLAASGQQWFLTARKKGDTVELCMSNGDDCPGPSGVSPNSISVYRWDNMHDNVLVWDAEPDNPLADNTITGDLTWGVPPEHWTNKLTPPALVCGKAYLVNPGAHYFGLACDGTVTVFDAPKLEEFFRKNKSATPVKGDPSKDTMGPE
jgi:hypothetical protein